MTQLTYDEQWYDDLDWFAVDQDGRLGHFATAGFRLLPPAVAANKENWQALCNYFNQLPAVRGYRISPELDKQIAPSKASDEKYLSSFAEMSARGLYSYDTFDYTRHERPYFRVTIPEVELKLEDLPPEIASILRELQFNDLSFIDACVIADERAERL